jgi:uncharacterized protein YkwD
LSVSAVRRVLLAALLIVCIQPPAGASASARHDRTEAGIVRAINKIRAQYHLPRLRINSGLGRAADVHSAAMARSGRVVHGEYYRRVRRYVRSRHVGENLAWAQRCRASAIVSMWMNSAGLRHVMLSRGFRRVGVARRSASRTCFVTADFASSR